MFEPRAQPNPLFVEIVAGLTFSGSRRRATEVEDAHASQSILGIDCC